MTAIAPALLLPSRPVLLLTLGLEFETRRALGDQLPEGSQVRPLGRDLPALRGWRTVLLAVRNRQHLRLAASALPDLGRCDTVACWVDDAHGRAPSLVVRPNWPALRGLRVECADRPGPALVVAAFAGAAPVRDVLLAIARSVTPAGSFAAPGPLFAVPRGTPSAWPVADPRTHVLAADGMVDVTESGLGPDLVLRAETDTRPDLPPVSGLTADAMVGSAAVRTVRRAGAWVDEPPAGAGDSERWGPVDLGPLDDQVLNPVGFLPEWSEGVVELKAGPGPRLRWGQGPGRSLDASEGVSDADVAALRPVQGVHLTWRGGGGPRDHARVVAGLALAGVPLTAGTVPVWAQQLLAPDLVAQLRQPVDLSDGLQREVHSLRLRRAAHAGHAAPAWRRAVALRDGLPVPRRPTVSVLLATRRPGLVEFALGQLGRQQDVDLEIVLATHGFSVGQKVAEAHLGAPGVRVVTVPVSQHAVFGDVLNAAAERASGDVLLKTDDDDWYGPRFVADLLMARQYSGSAVVGCGADFTYLEPRDLTLHRKAHSEIYAPFVAGGTLLIGRSLLRDVGGFRRVRRSVDAALLEDVAAAGALVYRTQGLGYLLRRRASGHTWDPGVEYFLERSRLRHEWPGFRPPPELQVEPHERPDHANSQPGDSRR